MKFSIVMPAFNAEAHIEESILSVLNQSYENFELIVVDDGSVDKTSQIVSSMQSVDSRVKLLSQSNSGKPSIARNLGLQAASGDVLTFLDSDDIYFSERLEKMAQVLSTGADYVIHDISLIDIFGRVSEPNYFRNCLINEYLHESNADGPRYSLENDFLEFFVSKSAVIHTSSIAVKMDSSLEWRFREDFLCAEDLIMWASIIDGRRGVFINEALSGYRNRPGSVSKVLEYLDYDTYRYLDLMLNKYSESFSSDAKVRVSEKMKKELLDAAYGFSVSGQKSKAVMLSLEAILLCKNREAVWCFLKSLVRGKSTSKV